MIILFYLVLMEVTCVFQLVDRLVSGTQDGGIQDGWRAELNWYC